MNTELTNVLNQIKQDKDENLTPQNIKKDVTVLGITGTYDPKPNLQSKTATLSAEENQVIGYDSGYDGLSTVTVPKVTASIDNKLVPGNIKRDVTILGITGNYGSRVETKRVSASPISDVSVVPSTGLDFLERVIINKVTADIDPDITAQNIKYGVNILGVEGTYAGDYVIQDEKQVNMSGYNLVVNPDSGYNAIKKVIINHTGISTRTVDARTFSNTTIAPTSGIAMSNVFITNISPNIIKHGVNIFGITGEYIGDMDSLQEKYVTPRSYVQNIVPDPEYYALSKVVVNASDSSVDSNITPNNIKAGVNILGVTGRITPLVGTTHNVDPSTATYTYYPGTVTAGATGFTSFKVNGVTANIDDNIQPENIRLGKTILGVTGNFDGGLALQEKTALPSFVNQEILPDENYDALSKVKIEAVNTSNITITPSGQTQNFTPVAGTFYQKVTVNGVSADVDNNIQPENIKKNMTILGVTGTYAGDTSEFFGSLSGGDSSNLVGSWVHSIIGLPDTLAISGTSMNNLFRMYGGSSVPTIDTSLITSADNAFRDCINLVKINSLNTSNLTNAQNMFSGCTNLASIPRLNGHNLKYVSGIFNECSKLNLNVSDMNIETPPSLENSFYNCHNLTGILRITNSSTGNVPMNRAFANCTNLDNIIFEGGNIVTNTPFSSAFENTKISNLPNLTSLVFSRTNLPLKNVFKGCTNLTGNIDASCINIYRSAEFENMFAECTGITEMSNLTLNYYISSMGGSSYTNTENIRGCANLFRDCSNLETLSNFTINMQYLSLNNNYCYSQIFDNMFAGCTNLENLDINIIGTGVTDRIKGKGGSASLFSGCTKIKKLPKFCLEKAMSYHWSISGLYNSSIEEISDIRLNTVYFCNLVSNKITKVYNIHTNGSNAGIITSRGGAAYETSQVGLSLSNAVLIDLQDFEGTVGPFFVLNSSPKLESFTLPALDVNNTSAYNMFYMNANPNFFKVNGDIKAKSGSYYNATSNRFSPQYAFFKNAVNVYNFCNKSEKHSMNEVRTIAVTNMPNKLSYNVGESFDPTGMVLTAQNLLDANYDLDNHEVVETLGEEYTLSTYSIDKTTLSAGDTSVNVYVTNPLNNTKVEIPITVTE